MPIKSFTERANDSSKSYQFLPFITPAAVTQIRNEFDEKKYIDTPLLYLRSLAPFFLSIITPLTIDLVFPSTSLIRRINQNPILFISFSAATPVATWAYEYFRATQEVTTQNQALDKKVLGEYQDYQEGKLKSLSRTAIQHISCTPHILKEILTYQNSLSMSKELIMNILTQYPRKKEICETQSLLIESLPDSFWAQENYAPFKRLVKETNLLQSYALKTLLSLNKVDPQTIPKKTQLKIWEEVKNPETLDLLCKYGFDINITENSCSPLDLWADRSVTTLKLDRFISALNANARSLNLTSSNLADEVKQFYNQATTTDTLREKILRKLPKESFFSRTFPWKASVIKEKDGALKGNESYKTILGALIGTFSTVSLLPFLFPHLPTYIILGFPLAVSLALIISILDTVRNQIEADRMAITQFLTTPIPYTSCSATIANSERAVASLIECIQSIAANNNNNDDLSFLLNKIDAEKLSLLERTNEAPIVKKLIQMGAHCSKLTVRKALKDPLLLAAIFDEEKIRGTVEKHLAEIFNEEGNFSTISEQNTEFLKGYLKTDDLAVWAQKRVN